MTNLKALYLKDKRGNFTKNKIYDVKISKSIGGRILDMEVKDDDGDWFTISKDGGKTTYKNHWKLIDDKQFPTTTKED